SQYPHRRLRHNPMAVKRQAIKTAAIITMAQEPILVNPVRALGLRRQTASRKLPGNARATAASKLAHVPMEKITTSAIRPGDRSLLMLKNIPPHALPRLRELFIHK